MNISRAILISLAISLALMVLLGMAFDHRVFGLFFFLPLGLLLRKSKTTPQSPPSPADRRPIEPK